MEFGFFKFKRNPYYQYFCGHSNYIPDVPCNATELVHFRNRIGTDGFNLLASCIKESLASN
jgi:IS5 family transposase